MFGRKIVILQIKYNEFNLYIYLKTTR